jgi:glycosyltransferase involved in cell wall biosynthesis
MKIAMIAEPYVAVPPPKYGGTERVIYHLIRGLKEQGHEITLLAPGDSEVPCRVVPTVPKALNFGKNTEENILVEKEVKLAAIRTKKLLRDLLPEVDIIHSHGFDIKEFQDFPNLTTLHGIFALAKMSYFEKRRGLFYVSISENQQGGFPDLQYVGVCYNGLDPAEFPYVAKPDDYVCFIGRLDAEKAPHLAIDLAIKLGKKIKVAGKIDFQGRAYYEEKIEPLFQNPLVEFLGELGHKEKVELLSHAQVNLHPTNFREPFGLTVLEAAYCGTPTLAIRRGSMPELIEEDRTGVLVEDFDEGYHAIEKCFELDRNYISQRARLLFNYKTMAKQYEIAYERVLDTFELHRAHALKTLERIQETRQALLGAWQKEK